MQLRERSVQAATRRPLRTTHVDDTSKGEGESRRRNGANPNMEPRSPSLTTNRKKKSASAEISRPCQQIVQNSGWLPHPNKQKQRLHSKTHTSHPHTLSLTHPLPQRHLVSLAPLSRLARCCLLRGLREWLEWHARPQLAPCRGMVQAPWPPGAATPPQAKRRQMP